MTHFINSLAQVQGELAALTASLFWAISSVLFNKLGKTIRPIEMNLLKGILAILLLIATSFLLKEQSLSLSLTAVGMLVISGAIGIGFGDTMYFESLNILGPRRTLLLTILAPVITAVLAWSFLGESLSLIACLGILVTVAGVAWVITENTHQDQADRGLLSRGILYGFLAALTQAIGAVISRWALTQTTVSALQSAIIRLVAGVLFLLIWLAFRREKIGQWIKPASSIKLWVTITAVVVLGAYLAIWLQQISFQHSRVGIAQTLLATSPLFILPISALQGDKLSVRAITGVMIAVAGICLLFLV